MDTLKRYLAENDIEYLEKVFATSESIGGLLPNPFVSQRISILELLCYVSWGIFEVRITLSVSVFLSRMYVYTVCMYACMCVLSV